MHELDFDLYERGANIAMSNMLYYCMPAFCGKETTNRFLSAFVTLMRERTPESIDAYYAAGAEMVHQSTNADFRSDLTPLVEPRLFHAWFDGTGSFSLEPAIPALFQHVATWGNRKPGGFLVVHDASKPVLATKAQFKAMMAEANDHFRTVGYDRRKFTFPLRATELVQADSMVHPSIQVADICAGAVAHFMKARINNSLDDLAAFVRDKWLDRVVDAVAPSTDVTPAELGTDAAGGINPVDPVVEYMASRGYWRD
jgi:hypothetical protein